MGLFDIFKKKEKTIVTIYSPINGKVIELKEVPDEAFAQKMVGDGCAIEPDKGSICSPIEGQLMNIFPTNHAIIFETIDGLEMIVHFGIDTVKLDGKGFQKLREPGPIKVGDEIVKYNLDEIKDNVPSTRSPIIINNMEKVEKIEVFEGISKNSINEIKNNSDTIELKKNEALYSDRQILDYVYFLVSGNVSLVKSNENGENKVIFLLNSGAMINEPLMRKNTSGIECWGFEDSKILRISLKTFDKIMSKDYILAKNCMLFMEKRIRRLYRQLKNSTSTNIEKKLAAKLYRLGTLYGIENVEDKFILINLNLTVTYLAKMLGYQRETVSRSIKLLNEKAIILLKDRKFYIDMEKARQFFKK